MGTIEARGGTVNDGAIYNKATTRDADNNTRAGTGNVDSVIIK